MDVCNGLKDIRRVLPALVIGLCGSLGAQTAPVTGTAAQEPALHLPPNPPTVTKFFPLSEIRRGQQGVAYTVFEGTKPEPMGVEILGVLHNAIGPRLDMILARLEGPKADYTGVVAGMSGSPVYIDGRLVGALAYRIGQFSKEPIAGITPISEMLGVTEQSGTPGTEIAEAALRPAPTEGPETAPSGALGVMGQTNGLRTGLIQPMDTPLVFSGFQQRGAAVVEGARAGGAHAGGGDWRFRER